MPEVDLAARLEELGPIVEPDKPAHDPEPDEQPALGDEPKDGEPPADEPGAQPEDGGAKPGQEEPPKPAAPADAQLPPEMLNALIEVDGEKVSVSELSKRQREMRKRFTQGLQEFAEANKKIAELTQANTQYAAMDQAVKDNPRLAEALQHFFDGDFDKAKQVYTDANYSPKPTSDPRVDELLAERAQERQTVWASTMNERLNTLAKDNPSMDRGRVIGLMGSENILQTGPDGRTIPMLTPEAAYTLAYHDDMVKAAKKAGYDEYKAAANKGGAAKATPTGAALGKPLPRKPKNAEEAIQIMRETGIVTDEMLYD